VKLYNVNAAEAAKPLVEYSSLADFFTRDLKPGLRPVSPGLVSPVDGTLRNFGAINKGSISQIKDKTYSLDDFLADRQAANSYRNGFFCSLYLAPHDYHHIHSPVTGEIVRTDYIPGNLWPVTNWSLSTVNDLFSENERIVIYIKNDSGTLALVMVGATNVGKMSLSYSDFISNQVFSPDNRAPFSKTHENPIPIAAGERVGTFHLGSTVVLLFEDGAHPIATTEVTEVHKKVRYGESLF